MQGASIQDGFNSGWYTTSGTTFHPFPYFSVAVKPGILGTLCRLSRLAQHLHTILIIQSVHQSNIDFFILFVACTKIGSNQKILRKRRSDGFTGCVLSWVVCRDFHIEASSPSTKFVSDFLATLSVSFGSSPNWRQMLMEVQLNFC